jgi:hypothetical protein
MIKSDQAKEIAAYLRALSEKVHEDEYVLSVHVRDALYTLADAIEANETVMSGIDIMRRVRAGTG